MTRRGAELVVAALFAAGLLFVSGVALFVFLTISPVHTDPAAVPSTAAAAQPGRYSGAVDESRRLTRAQIVEENLAGLSVAVAVDGAIVWAEGLGWADVERHVPVTPITRFRLGSVSKTLTAAAIALLHDRGRIDLDAPVQRYVPAYPDKRWPVTTRQLMGDVAGVHRIRGDNNDLLPGRTARAWTRRWRSLPANRCCFSRGPSTGLRPTAGCSSRRSWKGRPASRSARS